MTAKWSDNTKFAVKTIAASDYVMLLSGTSNAKSLASDFVFSAQKNAANGVAGLDSNANWLAPGKISLGRTSDSALALLDIVGGADSTGANGVNQVSFSYYGASSTQGYRHFIKSWHDASTADNNKIQFWINSSGTAAGSTAPGVGNVLAFEIGQNGCIVPGTLSINDNPVLLHAGSTQVFLQYYGSGGIRTSFGSYAGPGAVLTSSYEVILGAISISGSVQTVNLRTNQDDTNIYSTNCYTNGNLYLQNGNTQFGMQKIAAGGSWGGSPTLANGGTVLLGYDGVVTGGYNTSFGAWKWTTYSNASGDLTVQNSIALAGYVLPKSPNWPGLYFYNPNATANGQLFALYQNSSGVMNFNIFSTDFLSNLTIWKVSTNTTTIGDTIFTLNSTSFIFNKDDARKTTTNTWTVTSDERIKESVETISPEESFNRLSKVRWVSYYHKDEFLKHNEQSTNNKRKHVGAIAQEHKHKDAYPDSVTVIDDMYEDMHTLNIHHQIIDCLNAMQHVKKRLEALEARH